MDPRQTGNLSNGRVDIVEDKVFLDFCHGIFPMQFVVTLPLLMFVKGVKAERVERGVSVWLSAGCRSGLVDSPGCSPWSPPNSGIFRPVALTQPYRLITSTPGNLHTHILHVPHLHAEGKRTLFFFFPPTLAFTDEQCSGLDGLHGPEASRSGVHR